MFEISKGQLYTFYFCLFALLGTNVFSAVVAGQARKELEELKTNSSVLCKAEESMAIQGCESAAKGFWEEYRLCDEALEYCVNDVNVWRNRANQCMQLLTELAGGRDVVQ